MKYFWILLCVFGAGCEPGGPYCPEQHTHTAGRLRPCPECATEVWYYQHQQNGQGEVTMTLKRSAKVRAWWCEDGQHVVWAIQQRRINE